MTATTERATLPPVECFPWCQYGNGHPNQTLADDQTCFTAETHIPGALLVHDPGCEDEEEYATVYAMAWAAGHRPTQIQVGRGEDIGMQLTIDEARQVAEAILRTIATVDGATERTVLEEDDGEIVLAVDNDDEIVGLEGDMRIDKYVFSPKEAREFAYAILAHAARVEVLELAPTVTA